MTLYQIECFLQVAETLSFVRAAEKMCLSQPAITYQIRSLEKEISVPLLERNTRCCKLTAAGQAFYQDMVQMHSYYCQAVQKAQDICRANTAHLTVGIRKLFDYERMARLVTTFYAAFPHATVDILPQNDARPLEDLRDGRIDVGFYYSSEHTDCSDIAFLPLYKLNYYVLMHPQHPLSDRPSLFLSDLKGQSVATAGSVASFLSACQGPSLTELKDAGVDISRCAPSFEGALIMMQAGAAMLILPMLPFAVVPGMVKIPLLNYPSVHIEIAWRKRDNSASIPVFVDIAKKLYESL